MREGAAEEQRQAIRRGCLRAFLGPIEPIFAIHIQRAFAPISKGALLFYDGVVVKDLLGPADIQRRNEKAGQRSRRPTQRLRPPKQQNALDNGGMGARCARKAMWTVVEACAAGVHWAHCKNAPATSSARSPTQSARSWSQAWVSWLSSTSGEARLLSDIRLGAAIAETLLSDALVSSPSVVGINSKIAERRRASEVRLYLAPGIPLTSGPGDAAAFRTL